MTVKNADQCADIKASLQICL